MATEQSAGGARGESSSAWAGTACAAINLASACRGTERVSTCTLANGASRACTAVNGTAPPGPAADGIGPPGPAVNGIVPSAWAAGAPPREPTPSTCNLPPPPSAKADLARAASVRAAAAAARAPLASRAA
eukprot:scaffold22153_cov118-Isochrysis_galbana.AAC.2